MMLFDNNDNDVDVNADDDNSPFVCKSVCACVRPFYLFFVYHSYFIAVLIVGCSIVCLFVLHLIISFAALNAISHRINDEERLNGTCAFSPKAMCICMYSRELSYM